MKYKEIVIGIKVVAKTKHDFINAVVLGFKPNSYTKVELMEIGEMSDAQKEYKSRIENAGGVYFVAKSFDDFYTQINKFL